MATEAPEMTAEQEEAERLARGLGPVSEGLSIYERLGRIVGELPAIPKDRQNEQQKFMFRGYDDVLNALNPLLAKYGVFFVPDVVERIVGTRTTNSGSTMYEVNLHVRFRFFGPDGNWVEGSGWGEGTDMGDKATSKAMTMALKYVLFQTFAISTEEASDADASSPEETTRGGAGGGRQRQEPQEELITLDAALAGLAHYVEDGKPWIKAAVEGSYEGVTLGNWNEALSAAQKKETLKRLKALLDDLHKHGEVGEVEVKAAFAAHFGDKTTWPAYVAPIPF